jgi:SHS2 domain-containing protein
MADASRRGNMTIADNGRNPHGNPGYREIAHTADRALCIRGRNLQEILVHAARGMNHLMLSAEPGPDAAAGDKVKKIEIEALDAEALLVSWLSELAFFAETAGLVFHRFDFKTLSPTRIRAEVHGRKAEKIENLIKAVTYHNLAIVPTADGLSTTVVFDV